LCEIFLPIICLIFIAIPSFTILYIIEDLQGLTHLVKIIGNQWFWTYEFMSNGNSKDYVLLQVDGVLKTEQDLYNQGAGFRLLMTENCIYFLYLIKTSLYISSNDVLHSWAVPSLGLKIDACPGRINKLVLWPGRLGVFYGQCSEICGINHSFMPVMLSISNCY